MHMMRRDERGLTLIETMAALTVFTVITLGVAPLIGSSIRGSALARAITVAKDLSQQGMERARGLPFYIAYQAQPKKVDVLDLFFPCADPALGAANGCTGEGTRSYNAATGVFTITCASTDTGPTCAVPIQPRYSITYATRFVRGDGSTLELPPSTYKRNPSSLEGPLDTPPTTLVELTVTTSWTLQGRTRTMQLRSLLGDRKFGPTKLSATARVNYGVQVQTSFLHNVGDSRQSDLKATAGNAESRVVTRLVSTARQSVRAAEMSLIRRPLGSDTVAAPLASPWPAGVVVDVAAPPDASPAPAASPAGITTLTHPNVDDPRTASGNLDVASTFTTRSAGIGVSVASERSSANGGFSFDSTGADETGIGYFWVMNQADPLQNALLRLDLSKRVFSLKSKAGAQMTGDTSITTTPITDANRAVRAQADVALKFLRAMPLNYAAAAPADERHALVIKDFSASVDCKATGNIASSEVPVASNEWSANLIVLHDQVNNGSVDNFVQAQVLLDSDNVTATRTDVKGLILADGDVRLDETGLASPPFPATNNPLLFDGATAAQDVYLFQAPGKNGYLTSFTVNPVTKAVELSGDLARSSIDGAMHIATVPTNPALEQSGLNITVGSVSCEALDQR